MHSFNLRRTIVRLHTAAEINFIPVCIFGAADSVSDLL